MLCKYCANLDFDAADSRNGAPHHESFADLVASADNGCELCKWIADEARLDPVEFTQFLNSSERITCYYVTFNSSLRWDVGSQYPARLNICAAKDDPMSKIVECRPVCSDIRSEKFYRQIRTWIKACSSKHRGCQPRGHSRLPTRVIDAGKPGNSVSLFTSNGQSGQWVALSYCWGNEIPLRTLSSNLESFQNEISLELLPQLFQDAVTIVRGLGYRYLWIDALCIIQDSESDWLNESAEMGSIFQNAALTILAEAAENSSVGLFSSMEQERKIPSIVIQAHRQSKSIQGHVSTGIDQLVRSGPLTGRAWTLQEELLSPCVIRFAKSQVWWQCREALRCETYPNNLCEGTERQEWHWVSNLTSELNKVLFKRPSHIYRRRKLTYVKDIFPAIFSKINKTSFKLHHRDTLPPLLQSWYMILNTYVKRKSTYVKDTFPAISGIAKEYRRHGLKDYKAGLWLEDMHQGLLWTTFGAGCRTQTPYVAPSWSWASIETSSDYGYDRGLREEVVALPLMHVARIKSVDVALLSEDPFGQIKAAKLSMTGPSIQICRNEVPWQFMDIKNEHFEDGCLYYRYPIITYPRDNQEYKLHWSLRKTATCNIWTVESVTRKPPYHLQHPCLLLHVASHQGKYGPRCAFCLILESVPDEEDQETSEQNESIDMNNQSDRSNVEEAGEKDTQAQHLDTETREKAVQYRRIGLAILQETVPTSTIWSERTVTII